MTQLDCSLLHLPHYLQACTNNLLNMEGVLCTTTNSQLEVIVT